jgi:hypothetical protein
MKVCRVFLAALSTVVLSSSSLPVIAADAAPCVPAIARGLAQNRSQQPQRQRQPLPCPVRPLLRPESPSPLRQLTPQRPQPQPQRQQFQRPQPQPQRQQFQRPQPQPQRQQFQRPQPQPQRQQLQRPQPQSQRQQLQRPQPQSSSATPSSPGPRMASPSGAGRIPAAQGASVVRLDPSQPQGDNLGASGLVRSRLSEHHWGYGWHVGRRPGDFHRLPPAPRQSHSFQHWDYLYDRSQFTVRSLPRELRVILRSGQSMSFQVEEDMTSGYRWIAHYDHRRCSVVIAHRITPRSELILPWSDATGMAEIEIHARTPGMLVIDLVYAKPQE